MPLEWLIIGGNPISDISPLKDMPLSDFDATGLKLTALEPFREKPPLSLRLNWECLETPYFEALLENWKKTGQDPRIISRARVSRLIRTGQIDKLRELSSEFNGHHYLLAADWLHFDDARKLAEKAGGHLVTLNTREEQQFVTGMLFRKESIWLGLLTTDKGERWMTGEPLTYSNLNRRDGNPNAGNWTLFYERNDSFWYAIGKSAVQLTAIEWDN